MFSRIKIYIQMKRVQRQMKYLLMTKLFLCVENTDKYIQFFNYLITDIDYDNFQSDLLSKLTIAINKNVTPVTEKNTEV